MFVVIIVVAAEKAGDTIVQMYVQKVIRNGNRKYLLRLGTFHSGEPESKSGVFPTCFLLASVLYIQIKCN